jgi:hypothetical protein
VYVLFVFLKRSINQLLTAMNRVVSDTVWFIRRKLLDDCGGRCEDYQHCCTDGNVETAQCCSSSYDCCGSGYSCCYYYDDNYYSSSEDSIDGELGTILGCIFGALIILFFLSMYFYVSYQGGFTVCFCIKKPDEFATSSSNRSGGNTAAVTRSPLAPIEDLGPSQMYRVVCPNGIRIREDTIFSPIVATVSYDSIFLVYDNTTKSEHNEVRVRASFGAASGWATIWLKGGAPLIEQCENVWNENNAAPVLASALVPTSASPVFGTITSVVHPDDDTSAQADSPSAPPYPSSSSSSSSSYGRPVATSDVELMPTYHANAPNSSHTAATAATTTPATTTPAVNRTPPPAPLPAPAPKATDTVDDPYESGISVAEFQRRLEIQSLRERIQELNSDSS